MFAVIRIRGKVKARKETENALKMLGLKAVNNCTIIPESQKGMIEKVRDMVTYGEIKKDVLKKMLERRLRVGKRRVNKKILKKITGFDSFESFADALLKGRVNVKDFELNRVFRLTPPSKGFKSVKEFYPKGDLGYRGKKINELIERMV